MTDFILQFIFFVVLAALVMEVYKKRFRGDGEKTNASRYELWGVAFVVSALFAIALRFSNDLSMGWWALPVYALGIYAAQFYVSMSVVKSFFKGFMK